MQPSLQPLLFSATYGWWRSRPSSDAAGAGGVHRRDRGEARVREWGRSPCAVAGGAAAAGAAAACEKAAGGMAAGWGRAVASAPRFQGRRGPWQRGGETPCFPLGASEGGWNRRPGFSAWGHGVRAGRGLPSLPHIARLLHVNRCSSSLVRFGSQRYCRLLAYRQGI